MRPAPPPALLDQIERWAALARWERAEVGRALRRLGWSYGEIRAVIDVPKATLAGWCRDIHLRPEQIAAITRRGDARRRVPRDTQRKRRLEIARIEEDARDFAEAHLGDALFVAGTTLYWGEGAKTTHPLALSNADEAALRLFMQWTRSYHDPEAAFVLSLHLHAGNDEAAARRWWAAHLGLSNADFTKTFIKPPGTGHRKNHLAQGVCKVRMRRSADAWVRTMAWIDVLRNTFAPDNGAMP